jgi:flagellar biosynthesis/type III secretory pathway M-ring protein FliF/YscJ
MPVGLQIGVVVAALLLVIAPVLLLSMRRRRSKAVSAKQKALEGDASVTFEEQLASRAASQEKLDADALMALKLPPAGTKKSEILAKHLKKAVKHDPAVAAQLLRTWMNENDSS